MAPFLQMRQLVYDDIFNALRRFFSKLQVQPDPSGLRIAAASLRFHLLDTPPGSLDACNKLPLLDQGGDHSLQLFPVPVLQHPPPLVASRTGPDMQFQH